MHVCLLAALLLADDLENARVAVSWREGSLVLAYKLAGAARECARIGAESAERRPDGLEVRAKASSGKSVSFRVALPGEGPIVEISGEASDLVLSARGARTVVPDVFGDDLVFRDEETRKFHMPAERAFLRFMDQGDAILMCHWSGPPRDVVVDQETLRIPRSEGEKIWISPLAAKGIWREEDSGAYTPFEYKKSDWTPPFPARWRCDLEKTDGLVDSWKRATARKRVWLSFLNYCNPPLVIDSQEAYFRVPKFRASGSFARDMAKEIRYRGPMLAYPLARETEASGGRTPPEAWTVLDVVAATLGENLLNVLDAGQGVLTDKPYPPGFVYTATCGATGDIEEIFKAKKERDRAQEIREEFRKMDQFVRYNRGRIEEYVKFAAALKEFLAGRKVPEAATLAPPLEYILEQYEEQKGEMKTPDHCRGLAEKVIELIDSSAEDKLKQVRTLGKAIRTIGGTQDDLVAACRFMVKILRQRAGLIHARSEDAAVRETMMAVLEKTHAMLRTRSPYEGH